MIMTCRHCVAKISQKFKRPHLVVFLFFFYTYSFPRMHIPSLCQFCKYCFISYLDIRIIRNYCIKLSSCFLDSRKCDLTFEKFCFYFLLPRRELWVRIYFKSYAIKCVNEEFDCLFHLLSSYFYLFMKLLNLDINFLNLTLKTDCSCIENFLETD